MLLNILIAKEDDGFYYPRQFGGYNKLILPSEFENILQDLMYYCEIYSDDEIREINKNIEEHFFDSFNVKKKYQVKKRSGYVYMLKCADKYKIGYSNNVENRIKELDTRPFKLKLIFKVYSDAAYQIEQELHKRLEIYRDVGEWYLDITEKMIKDMIDEIGGYLKCDIQY